MTPLTPVMVKSGRKATTMTSVENIIGPPTSDTALSTRSRPPPPRVWARWRWMFSTTMTVDSTMMPKSTAPSEMRFAGVPVNTMPANAASSASGTLSAAMSAARPSPRNSQSISATSAMPTSRFSTTVCVVSLVRVPRS